MVVRDYMSSPAITVRRTMPFQEALKMMRDKQIRRLPVVNQTGWLVGIVTERDLLLASPSPATSLNMWELNYLLSKLTVGEVMTQKALVVAHPDMTMQEAANLLMENRIGGMPVLDERNQVVGVITETDIFRAFVTLFSAQQETDAPSTAEAIHGAGRTA